jgi:hypothetical protein
MKSVLSMLVMAAAAATVAMAGPYPIKHIVVLMAENRAFDHMLASALGNETNTATNPLNVSNPSQGLLRFQPNAPCTRVEGEAGPGISRARSRTPFPFAVPALCAQTRWATRTTH